MKIIALVVLIMSLGTAQGSDLFKKNRYDRNKQMHGKWKMYWDDEEKIKMSHGRFRHGKPVGRWKYYNNQGQIEKFEIIRRKKGVIKTTVYHTNGQVQKKGLARIMMDKDDLVYYWFGEWKCYD